jgi:predicted MFS family arabinose efflux permease
MPLPLVWLALGAFAIGTGTFVIAALVPLIAADLAVPVAAVGRLVTVFALAYAVGSPLLSILTGNVNRKLLLVLSLLAFALANLVAASAQDFTQLAFAHVLLALAAGLYTPAANATAAALVPPELRGRAIAVVAGGMSSAMVLGVPLGSSIAAAAGWRAAFLLVAAAGALGVLGLLLGLPQHLPRIVSTLGERLAVARRPEILNALLVTLAFAVGMFSLYTFIAPFLMHAAGLSAHGVSATLFVFGVGATAGNVLGGYAADRFGPWPSVRLGLVAFTFVFLVLAVAANALPIVAAPFVIVAAVGLWGVVGWVLYVAQLSYLARLAPDRAGVALSLNASAFYLGIAAGAALGSVVVAQGGVSDLAWIAALGEMAALAILQFGLRPRSRSPVLQLEPGE